jgi:glycosyltransferase involved in cell wall biosynthesis
MGWFSEEAGGLSRYSSGLVDALTKGGDPSRILVTGTDRVEAESRGLAIPFASKEAPMFRRLTGSRRLFAKQLREFRPDVCAFHFALYARSSLGILGNVPRVCHFHGPWAMESMAEGASRWAALAKENLVEKPVYRSAARLVTLSRFFADILVGSFGIPSERVRVVPGGFDPSPFLEAPSKERAKEILGLPTDRPLLVCVRRLAHRMGLENLVDAIALVRKSCPDVLLLVAGKGPMSSELSRRIEENGLTENVRLLGFVPDPHLPALYAAAEFSIVPTVSLEGFGLIVAESLASGTPVIATRAGALPELLESFTPRLLSLSPEAGDLARVIEDALRGSVAKPGPAECRSHAARWSWSEVVPELKKVYQEAIAGS